MPQEKPAFFVEFFRNPLTEAYPEVFQPLGDGLVSESLTANTRRHEKGRSSLRMNGRFALFGLL